MATSTIQNFSKVTTNHLAAYAAFLLKHHLNDYTQKLADLYYKYEISLFRDVKRVDENDSISLFRLQAVEMLTLLQEKKIDNHLQKAILSHTANQKHVDVGTIVENITLLCFTRKQALLSLVENFTQEPKKLVALSREIDQYILRIETTSQQTFAELFDQQAKQQVQFTEKVTDTSPSIIFIFDRLELRQIYSNKKIEESLGYTPEELSKMGSDILVRLLHTDDLPVISAAISDFENAIDGEVRTCEFRVKDNQDTFHWIRCHTTIFKRNNSGIPSQLLSTATIIDEEKKNTSALIQREEQLQKTILQLQENEELFKEAQRITHIGTYIWDFETNRIEWSDELFRIHGLEPQSVETTYDFVAAFNHPDDMTRNREIVQTAIKGRQPLDFHYRILSRDGKTKMLHAKGRVLYNDNNVPVKLIGTAQDVTERHELIQNLFRSQELYKQAQTLSGLGNWRWDIKENRITWSDEMYNIFGMMSRKDLTYDEYLSMIHPDDRNKLRQRVKQSIENQEPYETYHRIVRRNGQVRHLHSKGNLERDVMGKPNALYGITQDVTEQQTLIERLERSEALYKEAQAISHLGNWVYDLQENKITWSDELFRIYGLEPQSIELTWELLLEMTHPDDREPVENHKQQALSSNNPFEFHKRIVRPDGIVKIVHIRGEVFTDEEGKPFRMFGTTQDVTEQKLIEEKLSNNQNFIQKIADAAPSIICSYDVRTGDYLFVNNSVQSMFGYNPKQVLEGGLEFIKSLIHPDDLPRVLEENALALENANQELPQEERETIFEFKYRIKHANGTYHWLQTFGTVFERDQNNRVQNILNISLDITEQVNAEALIKEQEHFIKHIVEASPTILYVFDLNKEIFEYVNKEVEGLLNYTANEITSLDCAGVKELYHPDDLSLLPFRLASETNANKSIHHFECRMKNKDGNWRWLLTREVVFKRGSHGTPQQILGAAIDITDRKEMEIMLRQKTFQLEQSNSSLEEFAYVASHDLKEPLRKISSFGDRLLSKHSENLDTDGKLFLEKMVDSSRRMQSMITDLLAVSRLSGNKSFEYCNLNDLLNETLQTLELQIEKKAAVIQADSLPHALVIPSQIRQLFQNLLSNSLKFVDADTQPTITITHRFLCPHEAATLNLTGAKKFLQIDFTDNGIGFDNQYANKIFAIFQRLHGKSEYGGSGIGLTICKKVVENHEGLIKANSKPGQGSIFSVIIPYERFEKTFRSDRR